MFVFYPVIEHKSQKKNVYKIEIEVRFYRIAHRFVFEYKVGTLNFNIWFLLSQNVWRRHKTNGLLNVSWEQSFFFFCLTIFLPAVGSFNCSPVRPPPPEVVQSFRVFHIGCTCEYTWFAESSLINSILRDGNYWQRVPIRASTRSGVWWGWGVFQVVAERTTLS